MSALSKAKAFFRGFVVAIVAVLFFLPIATMVVIEKLKGLRE